MPRAGEAIRAATSGQRSEGGSPPDPASWLRTLLNASPRPMNVVDREQHLVVWNRAAEETFGWPESEMLGECPPFRGFLPDECRGQWDAWCARVLNTGESLDRQMTRRRHAHGTVMEVSFSIAPLHGAAGEIVGLIVTNVDVSARTRFLQIAAHELRNPMASVKGVMSLIRMRLETGEPQSGLGPLIEVVEGEIDRLSMILTEILEGFRVAAGQLDMQAAPVDLGTVVASALRPFQSAMTHRFVLKTSDERPVHVWGDARRLEDCVRNLLSNARKYSPDGAEVRIAIDAAPPVARVSVLDRGIGVPPEDLPHVFDAFYRSPALAGRDPGGLGLGLYLCADVVRRHGGRIWAENNPDGGAAFRFELPLVGHAGRP